MTGVTGPCACAEKPPLGSATGSAADSADIPAEGNDALPPDLDPGDGTGWACWASHDDCNGDNNDAEVDDEDDDDDDDDDEDDDGAEIARLLPLLLPLPPSSA